MHWLRRVLTWALIFGAGAVLGPVLLAVVTALAAPSGEQERWAQAYDLLKAYDERNQQISLPTLDTDGAIRDCGYSSEGLFGSVFPPLAVGRTWTPYTGYFDLFLWRSDRFREAVEELRTNYVRQNFSDFQTSFLNACVRRTVFANVCARRVGRALESGGALSSHAMPRGSARLDQRRENRTICTYLDGLAARQGQPLSASGQRELRPTP